MSVARKQTLTALGGVGLMLLVCSAGVLAGSLDSPGAPDDEASASYTLWDLYHRLTGGLAGSKSAFTEPEAGPVAGGQPTLNAIMEAAPAMDDVSGAAAGDVVAGKTFWGLRSDEGWGPQTGTLTETGVPGVTAGTPQTGQTTTYTDGDDGDLQHGVAWPDPRFTDHGDGTVTDELTGLMWTRNANLGGRKTWNAAIAYCNSLNHGGYSDWRLPNIQELQSLVDYGHYNPALPSGHPFTGVVSSSYWSGTTFASQTFYAWVVPFFYGFVGYLDKTYDFHVWPVRAGQ